MPDLQNKKVLVLDDDELNLKLFHDLLSNRGAEVMPVNSAKDLGQIISDFNPDLILMDIQLNETTGIDIIYDLKKNGLLEHVPVVAVTAFIEREDQEVLMDSGFSGFLAKPVTMHNFYEIINNTLAKGANSNDR